jgi:hypothetical protein
MSRGDVMADVLSACIGVHRRASACICVEPCLPCRTPQCAARDPGRRLPARTRYPATPHGQLRSAASPRLRRSGRQSKQKMEPQMHTDGLEFGMLVQGRTQPTALDEQRCRVGPESISVYRYASVVPFSCLPCRVSHPAQRALGSRCPARTPPRTPHRAPARHGTRLDHPAPRRLVFGTLPWRRHPMSSGPHVEIIAPQAIPPRTGRGSTPCTRTAPSPGWSYRSDSARICLTWKLLAYRRATPPPQYAEPLPRRGPDGSNKEESRCNWPRY